MKHSISVLLLLILTVNTAQATTSASSSLDSEFNSLGDNKAVTERIKKMETRQKIRVVQNRLVDRNNRMELSISGAFLGGGDNYVQTQTAGANLQYHITPRWSVGLEYSKAYNSLTPEGKRRFDRAAQALANNDSATEFPSIDFAIDTKMATLSFYPIYGKLNLFDLSIAQFDLYTLIGAGQKTLNSGGTNVYTAGLGIGFWLNSWLTSRLEVRYEKYQDLLKTEKRSQNSLDAIASIGLWLW